MADINDASGTTATGTNYSGLTSANYGITSPYVMKMLGRGAALADQQYTPFKLPGGEGQADSARVANLDPMEANAYNAMGGMNWQDPMNQGMGAVRNATTSQWGAGTASPYMNAYNASVGGGNDLYNNATRGIAGLDFQRGMARGMGGTEAAMNSSFNTSGGDYLSNYRNAVGGSSMMDQAGRSISGINPGANFRQGMNYMTSAANSQFDPRQANRYMGTVKGAVGDSAMTNQANRELSGFNSAGAINTGMNLVNQVGSSTFGGQGTDQYKAAQGTSADLNAASNAFRGANAAGNLQQGLRGLSQAGSGQFGQQANQYLDPMRKQVGTTNANLDQANKFFGGANAANMFQQGAENVAQAGSGQFGQQANQYLDPMRQQVGTSAGLNKATQAFGGIDTGNIMKQGMNMLTSAGNTQFGQQQANQYLKPMQQAVGTNAGLDQATKAFGQAGGAQGMQQGMQRLGELGGSSFGEKEAQQYMSPYMKNVVEQQKQGAMQDYARQLPGQSAAAFQAGAGRGTRSALLQAEGQRNLQNQLQDITAKGTQSAFENAQKQYGEDMARRMQAAQGQISSGTDITGRQAQLGESDLARKQQQYDTAARLYGEDVARKMQAGTSAVNAATDITGRQAQLGESEIARRQQQYDTAQAQYNADKARQMQSGQYQTSTATDLAKQQAQMGESEQARKQQQYEAAARLYGEDKARAMQAAQGQISAGTDIAGRQAQLGENELNRNVAAYTNAQNQYNTEQANKLAAANAAFGQGTDILGRKTAAGDTEFNRNMQMYQQGNQQYNTDIANRMQAGQNIFNMGSDIYGKQYQYGADELARNRDAYTAAQNQYNTEMQNRLAASGQLFNQAGDIYNRQYTAGDTQQQRQIDAYNRSMDQYNADMNRQMMGGQNMFNMGSDLYGKQVAGGESRRSQKQKELDAMYEDFQKEINQPKENTNYMMQLLGQVPQYSDYSTKSYQTAAPVDPNAAYANALGALGTYMGGGANGGSSASGWGGALEGVANSLGLGSYVDKFKSIFGGR